MLSASALLAAGRFQFFIERAVPYIALLALLVSLFALLVLMSIQRRLSRLMAGRNGSLEETLAVLNRDMKEMHRFRQQLEGYLKHVETRLRSSVQSVSMIRFNPFSGDGSGGNQSFAAAFLDENHNGVVLSSLYARDRAVVYGKPIETGASSFELTEEEKRAIAKAQETMRGRSGSSK